MQAKHERRQYKDGSQIWVGKYRNSQNFPHWHYDCELVFVEKGSLNIFCNGHLLKVSAGRTVFIDSEQIHFLHALTPDATVRQIIFSYDLIKDFAKDISLVSPLLSRDYGTAELYFTLANEFRNRKPFYSNSIICAVQKLMIEIFRNEPFGLKEKKPDSVDRLKPLMRDIEENFEFYTLDKAAEFMIMNPAYFSRLFHKLTGIPFSPYINSKSEKRGGAVKDAHRFIGYRNFRAVRLCNDKEFQPYIQEVHGIYPERTSEKLRYERKLYRRGRARR